MIRVLERERSVVKVAADLYLLRDAVDSVVRTLREEWAERDDITPALFRDRFESRSGSTPFPCSNIWTRPA